jgi:hypothetical protein
MQLCAHILLDRDDIVRDGDLSPTVPMRLNYSRIAPGKRRNAVE